MCDQGKDLAELKVLCIAIAPSSTIASGRALMLPCAVQAYALSCGVKKLDVEMALDKHELNNLIAATGGGAKPARGGNSNSTAAAVSEDGWEHTEACRKLSDIDACLGNSLHLQIEGDEYDMSSGRRGTHPWG